MLNWMRNSRGILLASILMVSVLGLVSVATGQESPPVQLRCKVNVETILHGSREGIVGLRAQLLDDAGVHFATKIWRLCYTEISDGLQATLPVDPNAWVSEQDCQNVLDTLNLAKALDRPIEIIFRQAPDELDPALQAETCEDVKVKDAILFRHVHQVAWGF